MCASFLWCIWPKVIDASYWISSFFKFPINRMLKTLYFNKRTTGFWLTRQWPSKRLSVVGSKGESSLRWKLPASRFRLHGEGSGRGGSWTGYVTKSVAIILDIVRAIVMIYRPNYWRPFFNKTVPNLLGIPSADVSTRRCNLISIHHIHVDGILTNCLLGPDPVT